MSVSLINGPLRLGISITCGGQVNCGQKRAKTARTVLSAAASDHRAMAGESSDDEGPEEVSLQSGRDAAAQQRSQENEVTQKSRCVPPSRLAQVACTLTHSTTAHSRARRDKKEATAKERKIVSAALKSQRFPSELLSQLPVAGWGAPSQPKPAAEDDAEDAEAERKRKRGRKRQPEAKPGMPTVFRRSHNLEVAVAPRSFGVAHGAELQAFLHEQLYGAGVKRISSTSFSALTRPSAPPPPHAQPRSPDSPASPALCRASPPRVTSLQARRGTLRPQRRRRIEWPGRRRRRSTLPQS